MKKIKSLKSGFRPQTSKEQFLANYMSGDICSTVNKKVIEKIEAEEP